MLNNRQTLTIKILHVLMVMLVTTVVITAILNTTLLSKESIMSMIDYALTVTNEEMSPTDSIFVARVIRQQLWQVHFYVSVTAVPIMVFIVAIIHINYSSLFLQNNSLKLSITLNLVVFLFMTISGFFLFYRADLMLSESTIGLLRDLHWIGLYGSGIVVVFHLYSVVVKRLSK
ncbi:MAG: cytochrome b/b6 domain-containing protein [Sulfurimonas sp.]|jgi:hypothetical protein